MQGAGYPDLRERAARNVLQYNADAVFAGDFFVVFVLFSGQKQKAYYQ